MKFYHIENPKRFIEKLTSVCKGSVELINEDGMHLELTDGTLSADMIPFSYLNGSIAEIEVQFTNASDCLQMMNYVANQKVAC